MKSLDIKTPEARSQNMSKIRSKNTRPEMYVRSALFKRKHRFRVNYKAVEGNPDIYFTRTKVAIFIHGCYWHRHHGCRYAYTPKSNVDFWLAKFEDNKKRDIAAHSALLDSGIRVLIIWECTVKKIQRDPTIHEEVMAQIEDFIQSKTQQILNI